MSNIIKSTLEHVANMKDLDFQGYHKFRAEDGSEYGSFEVFYEDGSDPLVKVGWYWWPCHPGYLPDGDSNGPFPTAEGAMLDALEGSDPHQGMAFPTPASWKKAVEICHAVDTAIEEGTRYERAFGDGNDIGG